MSFFMSNNTFDGSVDNLSITQNIPSPSQKGSSNLHTSNMRVQNPIDLLPDQASNDTNISSMLNNFSLGLDSSQQELRTMSYQIKISNIPDSITERESHVMFTLAQGLTDVKLTKDGTNPEKHVIIGTFDSLELVVFYANILNNKKELFGPDFHFKSTIDVVEESTQNAVSYQTMNVPSNFGRLAQSSNPLQYQESISQRQSQSTLSGVPPSNSNRANFLAPHSRFSFSDPFSLEANQQEITSIKAKSSSISHPPHQDISMNTGKSFLLMESDEINDKIWGPTGLPSSLNAFSSTPQPTTPTVPWNSSSNPNNNSTSNRRESSAYFGSSTVPQSTGTPTLPNVDIPQSLQMNDMSNSLSASSASMNAYGGIVSQMTPTMMNQPGNNDMGSTSGNAGFIQHNNNLSSLQNTTPLKSKLSSNGNRSIPNNSVTPPNTLNLNVGGMENIAKATSNSIKNIQKLNSSSTSLAASTGTATMSEADLSLLARVPPPANPADQNPPCNTLYVGNLPPDATEQELRQLFSNQEGFRRLSFRNKNGNGNGHGPMCFVEFDDVSFATRALAELYGSKLPRSTISNKGGIRLSFSKNPLGVRGPNSKKNSSSNSINSGNNTNATFRPNSANMVTTSMGYTNYNINYSKNP